MPSSHSVLHFVGLLLSGKALEQPSDLEHLRGGLAGGEFNAKTESQLLLDEGFQVITTDDER